MRIIGFSSTALNVEDTRSSMNKDRLVLHAIEPNFNRGCAWLWAWRDQTRAKAGPAHNAKTKKKAICSPDDTITTLAKNISSEKKEFMERLNRENFDDCECQARILIL